MLTWFRSKAAHYFNIIIIYLRFIILVPQNPIKLMQPYLTQKPYDIRSISLRQISDTQTHNFKCKCLMCSAYPFKKQQQLLVQQEDEMIKQAQEKIRQKYPKSFLERVLRGLIIPSNKIVKRGVQIYTPQVVFLEDGEPTSLYYIKQMPQGRALKSETEAPHLVKLKKDKIAPVVLQKIFNEHRKHYRDRLRKKLRLNRPDSIKKHRPAPQKGPVFSKGDNITSAVIRYIDGCETLISETQLIFLLQKRKTDPLWKKIVSIRNFLPQVSPNPEDYHYIDVEFDSEKPRFTVLMARAKQLMQTYSTKLLPGDSGYISDKEEYLFCDSLKRQSPKCFATYSFYRVAAFMAQFHDQKILKAMAQMFVNQDGHCYLLEVRKLETMALLKYNFTNEICQKMHQQQQHEKYHKKDLIQSEEIEQKAESLQLLMKEQYQIMKKKFGISNEPKIDLNQKLNNQCFSFLHPNIQGDISELIKMDMPLLTFRRKVLGQKQQRKPLVKPFNTKMTRDLYHFTPIKRSKNISTTLTHRVLDNEQDDTPRMAWRHRKSLEPYSTIST